MTRPQNNVGQDAKRLRGQFQTVVVVLSCYYVMLLSPKLVSDLYLATPAGSESQQLSTLSVPSVILSEHQLVVFFCRFSYHVYVASKLFVCFASWPAFRHSLLLMITCSCCGTYRH